TQREIWIEARVQVDPRHPQALVGPLDLRGPRRFGPQRFERGALPARAIEPEAVEGIDRPVAVGPVDSERVSSDEVHVLGDAGIGLAEDLEPTGLFHAPPPAARPCSRMPARLEGT